MASGEDKNKSGNYDKDTGRDSPNESPRDKRARNETTPQDSPAASPRNGNQNPNSFLVAASPPKFVSFEEIMKAASGVSNMKLAHEIVVEDNFKLQKEEPVVIEKQIKEIMQKAFWDALQEKLNEDPPDLSHAMVLLEEVRENLLALLLPHQKNFKAHIAEGLDIELIKQQADHGTLDFHNYAAFVISVMSKLCAPARDEQVAKLKEIKEIVPLYQEIYAILDLMKFDMANFTLQQMKPYIQQQSVEYERKKFNDFLKQQQDNNVDGLEFTRSWLRRNAEKLYQKAQSQAADQAVLAGMSSEPASTSPVTPAAVLNTAYLELLQWDSNIIYPESLVMDQGRCMELQDRTRWLSLVASILLVTYSTVGGPIAGIAGLKENFKDHIAVILADILKGQLDAAMVNVSEQINKDIIQCMADHGFPEFSESQQELLKGQLQALASDDHPVRKLMHKRLLEFVFTLISSAKPDKMQVPAGFSAVSEDLSRMCGKFMRIISHNGAVFGHHYGDMISTIMKELEQTASESI